MIERRLLHEICARLSQMPAVAILGPRQTGKTTLSLEIANQQPSLYLDLQLDAHRARLDDPAAYLSEYGDKLVILDEISIAELAAATRNLSFSARPARNCCVNRVSHWRAGWHILSFTVSICWRQRVFPKTATPMQLVHTIFICALFGYAEAFQILINVAQILDNARAFIRWFAESFNACA